MHALACLAMKSPFPPCFKTCGADFVPTSSLFSVQPQLAVFSGSSLDQKVSVPLVMRTLRNLHLVALLGTLERHAGLCLTFAEAVVLPWIMSKRLLQLLWSGDPTESPHPTSDLSRTIKSKAGVEVLPCRNWWNTCVFGMKMPTLVL